MSNKDLDQSKYSNHVLHCQFAAVTDTVDYIDHTMQKRIFGHIQTAKTRISLRVHALWSRPSLFLLTESLNTTACMNGGQKPDKTHFMHEQDDLNLGILRMFNGTFFAWGSPYNDDLVFYLETMEGW